MQLSKPAISKAGFVEHVIFNYLIGNCDAHGKNFSLIYRENGVIELSSAYDILCTCVYEGLTTNMSMKIGKTKEIEQVTHKDWQLFAKHLDIKPEFIKQTLKNQVKKLPGALEKIVKETNAEIGHKILEYASKNCDNVIRCFAF